MSSDDISRLRALYREACHGAGAAPRISARKAIQALLLRADTSLREAFEQADLSMAAYFASRPITTDASPLPLG